MSQEVVPQDSAEDESGVAMFHLSAAVPQEEMPPVLLELAERTPAGRIRVQDIQSLDPAEQATVLAVFERAAEFYREKSGQYRGLANPAERTADHLEAFLEAARR